MSYFAIAIDGPAGAGKSTIAKALAEKLNCVYLDTGAIYRTVAYHMDMMGIGPKDVDGVTRLIDDVNIQIEFPEDGRQHMILNGYDVTDEIRTQAIGQKASLVSALPIVREVLLDLQRNMAANNNVVMDGRDIGTVVLPDADVKIFLTASVRVRAARRLNELVEKGKVTTLEEVMAEIERRDDQDSTRKVAPLRCAADAIRVDTSKMDIPAVIDAVMQIVEEKIGKR